MDLKVVQIDEAMKTYFADPKRASSALRVFQRYFSTKPGRGLGTYSMKLIAKRCLGGAVTFSTGKQKTTFTLSIPLERADT